jgi:DNA-binding NarL/FixJ family response regulator
MTIRVLVSDDQPLVRAGVRTLLGSQADIEIVGEAADGAAAIVEADRLHPDVVLMDVRMPGTDGIKATGAIARDDDSPRVLVLTTYDLDEYVFDALLAPSVTRRLIAVFARGRGGQARQLASRLEPLSEREREVLAQVARGLSNAEIAAALYITEHTVKTHVASMLRKLELRDRVHAVIFAYESGLLDRG